MTAESLKAFTNCSIAPKHVFGANSIAPFSHYTITDSGVVLGTAAVYLGKTLLKQHMPYVIYTDELLNKVVTLEFHFIAELRRQLSGEVTTETSEFNTIETDLFTSYQLWVDGGVISDPNTLLVIEALDLWLVQEVQLLASMLLTPCKSTNTVPKIKIEDIING